MAQQVCPLRKKHCLRAGTQRLRGLIRSVTAAGLAAGAAQNGKSLSSGQIHTMFKSNGTPLGECRFKHLGAGLIQRVTDRSAVETAMNEFDDLGREAFLEKHGFSSAKRYFVKRDGKLYDSKAIYGVAHQIQFPEQGAKVSTDFSGGEQQVQEPLEALGFEFEVTQREGVGQASADYGPVITSRDVRLIASSRSKQRYTDLSDEEHGAYVRVADALQKLGDLLKSKLHNPNKFEMQTTSGFHVNSGIRSYIPKDLWFSVSPRANSKDLAGMPQLFMIVSERGIEYGYGASISPRDFSQQTVKEIVRSAAPIVFDHLPSPDSPEATGIQHDLESSGTWYFRRKHRLPPKQTEFQSLKDWLRYLQSSQGKKNAAGTISRYLLADEVDSFDLLLEVAEIARLFEPLIDRGWDNVSAEEKLSQEELDLTGSKEFGARLSEFLRCYGEKRSGSFGVDDELGAAMRKLQSWLEAVPAVSKRPTIRIKVSVGQGGWTKTPWIALLDTRETTTTQRGTYIVFLIAEDLSITYLTFNQGMTELRNRLGQRGAAEEMVRVAEAARPLIPELEDAGFQLNNEIDLQSETGAAKNYEIGTIAHVALPSDNLPDDAAVHDYLYALLEAYDRVVETRQDRTEQDPEDMQDPKEEPPSEPYGIDDALSELFLEREDLTQLLETWRHKKNVILTGAPGVGKSFIAKRLAYALIGFKDRNKVQTVQCLTSAPMGQS